MNSHFYNLLNTYMLGTASKDEFQELEDILKNDPEACLEYVEYTRMDANLRSFALEGNEVPKAKKAPKFPIFIFTSAAALLAVTLGIFFLKPSSAAVVHSINGELLNSDSAMSGSDLYPGVYEMKSGGATLKLHSGVDLNVKAPIKFEIISDMQIKVLRGSLSAFVRESAKGFRVDTPYAYAIDHGTRFNVDVSKDKSTKFLVNDGLISSHHSSGKEHLLNAGQGLIMTSKSIKYFSLLRTKGDETTVIEDPKRILKDAVDPRFLLVKKSGLGFKNSRKSFFTFKLNKDKLIESARLTLNYLPTNMGERDTMPKESEFELYGIPDGANEKWKRNGMKWNEVPNMKELQLMGTFSIKRETESKTIFIDSSKLTQFIKEDNNGELSFVISCKTPGGKMVHGFASSKYGNEKEPKLEIFYEEE